MRKSPEYLLERIHGIEGFKGTQRYRAVGLMLFKFRLREIILESVSLPGFRVP